LPWPATQLCDALLPTRLLKSPIDFMAFVVHKTARQSGCFEAARRNRRLRQSKPDCRAVLCTTKAMKSIGLFNNRVVGEHHKAESQAMAMTSTLLVHSGLNSTIVFVTADCRLPTANACGSSRQKPSPYLSQAVLVVLKKLVVTTVTLRSADVSAIPADARSRPIS